MNEYLQVIILGVVQGISEFLPISSDGHLVIAEQLLGRFFGHGIAAGKDLEVMLHLGTLAAICVIYARDLWALRTNPRLCALLVVATIPAAAVGLLFEDWFDSVFDSAAAAGFGLIVTATLLYLGHVLERGRYTERDLPWPAMVLIGCFQAAALLPGVSRSGSTIVGGLLTGMDRISATRLSFMMAVPVTAGAIALTMKRMWEHGLPTAGAGPVTVGILVSFIVGWLVLQGFLKLVSQRRLHWFAGYCAAMGILTLAFCEPAPSTTPQVATQPPTNSHSVTAR
ncbi:MAG: hypothetical protein B7Z55_04810 [Planctomycetales bacterium 12-60-4]|nr:MAG: hypothetical protein B7Z55_04810 [Planctomycetales bacterium 12-60-4]